MQRFLIKKISFWMLAFALMAFFNTRVVIADEGAMNENPQDSGQPMATDSKPMAAEPMAADTKLIVADAKEVPMAGALDGKTFAGEIGKQGQTTGDKDNLIFKDGKFRSTACDAYGFGDAAYTTTTSGDTTTFEVATMSPTDGKMAWRGTVKGDMLEGTATWVREGKEPEERWVKGSIKQ